VTVGFKGLFVPTAVTPVHPVVERLAALGLLMTFNSPVAVVAAAGIVRTAGVNAEFDILFFFVLLC
jgi:hypothetical protein